MKNARVTAYTPDAIREAGEIIAAAILQGGGSGSVSWEQIVLTGTKIAEITINGETIEVYAPSGGGSGSSVSWEEIQTTGVKIAEITIDGTKYDVYAPDPDASDIDYDNSTSGLVATNVQAAIDEVYAETSTNTGIISDLNTEVGAHDTAITNLQTAVASKANESIIAPVEASLTASRAYAIGEQFILNGTLYTATAAITAGGTITINGNCTASDSVTEQIEDRVLFPNFSATPATIDVTPADTSGTLMTMDKNGWAKLAIVKVSGSVIGRIRADGNIILSSRAEIQTQDFIPLKKGTVLTYLSDSASTYRYIVQAYYD